MPLERLCWPWLPSSQLVWPRVRMRRRSRRRDRALWPPPPSPPTVSGSRPNRWPTARRWSRWPSEAPPARRQSPSEGEPSGCAPLRDGPGSRLTPISKTSTCAPSSSPPRCSSPRACVETMASSSPPQTVSCGGRCNRGRAPSPVRRSTVWRPPTNGSSHGVDRQPASPACGSPMTGSGGARRAAASRSGPTRPCASSPSAKPSATASSPSRNAPPPRRPDRSIPGRSSGFRVTASGGRKRRRT